RAAAASRTAPVQSLTVQAVQMPAWTTREGERIPLGAGDSVSTDHELQTAADAGLVLALPEGSLIRLGEKTRLGVRRLEASTLPDGRTGVRSELKLFDGFFRFATSAVARAVGERQIDVSLRTATIGVRGTDFWSMSDAQHDAVCLFEGKVDLATSDQGSLPLDRPTAFWSRFFDQAPQPVGTATPDELARFIASAELRPGGGIAVVGGRYRVVAATLTSASAAAALRLRLRTEGYPAQIAVREQAGRPLHQVRIDNFASVRDAQTVLQRIGAIPGVSGRVALRA
ncbi:MAG: FecR domain-containing protein, partial [Burkholderiaceae bacterium]|nr:FecR domain-containing protein [Burkholderiaceae bacterium]